jgi:hypothetical protein
MTTKRLVLSEDPQDHEGGLEIELGPIWDTSVPYPISSSQMHEDFGDWMLQSLYLFPFLSSDGYDTTFDSPLSISCYISGANKNIIKSDGTLAVSTAQIYLDGTPVVDMKDKISIDGNEPRILKVDTLHDETGSDYATVIYI